MPYINKRILEEYTNIRDSDHKYYGVLNENDNMVCVGTAKKKKYFVKLYIQMSSEGIIGKARFQAISCTVIMATTNYACRILEGKTIKEALEVTNEDMIKEFNMSESKEKENIIVEECIISAFNDFLLKNNEED